MYVQGLSKYLLDDYTDGIQGVLDSVDSKTRYGKLGIGSEQLLYL